MIITLCGSTSLKPVFDSLQHELALQGHIVLSPGVYSKYYRETLTEEEESVLIDLHFSKIDMSDMVYIIHNTVGPLGKHTKNELNYAQKRGKRIVHLQTN